MMFCVLLAAAVSNMSLFLIYYFFQAIQSSLLELTENTKQQLVSKESHLNLIEENQILFDYSSNAVPAVKILKLQIKKALNSILDTDLQVSQEIRNLENILEFTRNHPIILRTLRKKVKSVLTLLRRLEMRNQAQTEIDSANFSEVIHFLYSVPTHENQSLKVLCLIRRIYFQSKDPSAASDLIKGFLGLYLDRNRKKILKKSDPGTFEFYEALTNDLKYKGEGKNLYLFIYEEFARQPDVLPAWRKDLLVYYAVLSGAPEVDLDQGIWKFYYFSMANLFLSQKLPEIKTTWKLIRPKIFDFAEISFLNIPSYAGGIAFVDQPIHRLSQPTPKEKSRRPLILSVSIGLAVILTLTIGYMINRLK
jgi:hypothetical protein